MPATLVFCIFEQVKQETELEKAFKDEGYAAIPFTLNGAGHPTTVFQYQQHEITFLLDTGAAINLLDSQFAREIGLDLEITEGKGAGAGGLIHEICSVGAICFQCEGLQFPFDQFHTMDFETLRQSLEATGNTASFQGILGYGFFEMTRSYIDYVNRRIYVKPPL